MNLKEAILAASKADNVSEALRIISTAAGIDIDLAAAKADVDLDDFSSDNAESWATEDENAKAIDLCRIAAVLVGTLLPLTITLDIVRELKDEQDTAGDAPSSEVGIN